MYNKTNKQRNHSFSFFKLFRTLETALAAEQTKVTTLQTALADLTARFDKINSACLDDGARRLASAPCGAISKVQTTKDAGTTSTTVEFAVTHEIVLNGMSAAQFQSDPSIVTSFRETAAALLGVDTNKIINIVATSTRRSLYSFHRLLAGESCRYVCFFFLVVPVFVGFSNAFFSFPLSSDHKVSRTMSKSCQRKR